MCVIVAGALAALAIATPQASAQGGTWTTKAPIPTGRMGSPAGVIDGKAYVATGCCISFAPPYPNFTLLEIYDPDTDNWTTAAPAPVGLYGAASGAIGTRLYSAGGGNVPGNVATLQIYDAISNTWSFGASMPMASSG